MPKEIIITKYKKNKNNVVTHNYHFCLLKYVKTTIPFRKNAQFLLIQTYLVTII